MIKKTCKKCKQTKLISEFVKSTKHNCISCHKQYRTNYRQKNQQHIRNYYRNWFNKNQQHMLNYHRHYRNTKQIPYVYCLRNLINNEIIYIGSSSKKSTQRWCEHVHITNNTNSKAYHRQLYQILRKIGINNVSFEIQYKFYPEDYTNKKAARKAAAGVEKCLIAELNPDGNERGRSDGFQY